MDRQRGPVLRKWYSCPRDIVLYSKIRVPVQCELLQLWIQVIKRSRNHGLTMSKPNGAVKIMQIIQWMHG